MDQIGRYQLQAELGRGGFGRVYKAFDPTVGRTVAIKVLVSNGDPDLLMRFRNEAAATGKLRHRNIITIYDFGEQEGVPYLVME
jgi:eukaryotic-like serine/threonine-protein kinase